MNTQMRIKDMMEYGNFADGEIEAGNDPNTFKSIEFWQILHYTNEEWNYRADDGIESIADEEILTDKGIFYCFR